MLDGIYQLFYFGIAGHLGGRHNSRDKRAQKENQKE
jgi:hypothetical protein